MGFLPAAGAGLALLAALLAAPTGPANAGRQALTVGNGGHWVATWAAGEMAPTSLMRNFAVGGFNNQTVRDIVYPSIGGHEIRIRLSNAFGTGPVVVSDVSVGVVLTGATLAPGTSHPVTFGGQSSVIMPTGG